MVDRELEKIREIAAKSGIEPVTATKSPTTANG